MEEEKMNEEVQAEACTGKGTADEKVIKIEKIENIEKTDMGIAITFKEKTLTQFEYKLEKTLEELEDLVDEIINNCCEDLEFLETNDLKNYNIVLSERLLEFLEKYKIDKVLVSWDDDFDDIKYIDKKIMNTENVSDEMILSFFEDLISILNDSYKKREKEKQIEYLLQQGVIDVEEAEDDKDKMLFFRDDYADSITILYYNSENEEEVNKVKKILEKCNEKPYNGFYAFIANIKDFDYYYNEAVENCGEMRKHVYFSAYDITKFSLESFYQDYFVRKKRNEEYE